MPPSHPLVRARAYFEQRDDSMLPGLGVFALYVVGAICVVYLRLRWAFEQVAADRTLNGPGLDAIAAVLIVSLLATAIVSILVVAAVMHLVGGAGEGRFEDAVAVAGWAYAPNLLALPVEYVLLQAELRGITATEAAALRSQLQAARSTLGVEETLVLLAVTGWSVYILARGIQGTHDTELQDALGAAAIVGAGSVVLTFV